MQFCQENCGIRTVESRRESSHGVLAVLMLWTMQIFCNMKCESSVWNNNVTVKRALCKMSGRGRSRSHGGGDCGCSGGRGSGGSSCQSRSNDNDSNGNGKPEKAGFTPHHAGKTQGATCDTTKKQTTHNIRGTANLEMI